MRVRRHRRRSFLQSFAFLIAAAAALSGCATGESAALESGDDARAEAPRASATEDFRDASVAPAPTDRDITPREAIAFLRAVPDDGSVPLIVAGMPAAGLFVPAATGDTPPDGGTALQGLVMGAFTRDGSLLLRYRGVEGAAPRETVLSSAEDFDVRSVSTLTLVADSPRPNGVRLLLWSAGSEEEIFVLANTPAPYVMRAPVSTVNRTQLQDLNGDGTEEMVRISAIIDARGRRELMVDAYRWTRFGFEHAGSLALIRHLNDQLDDLSRRLRSDTSPDWKVAAADALEPIDGSVRVDRLLPATDVTIPEITDLSLNLGQPSWELSHEIAVEGSLYRLRVLLYPNPLAQQPTRIVGIEGH